MTPRGGASPDRYVCVHGHFYQPPRENPWLGVVEIQDSAYPYHDWNERIHAECYAPNADSRILDGHDRITRIVNNYASISFNFGPTLLDWLERHAASTYAAILDADVASARRFSGHGSAMAQAYGHPILPLCNARDRRTQVRWGIRDFVRRFGREPEGMWLPETAVDIACLEELAGQGIRFTVLSPLQARRVRPARDRQWSEAPGESLDTTVPYVVDLPSGRSIAVFFYDAAISRGVAFERLLARGDRFADRLTAGFAAGRAGAALVHIATDGETYGHHHTFGEMALSWALQHIESERRARLTNYAEFLARHPARARAEIAENTAWSCAHGLGRWREDCGCRGGGHPEWTQRWRAPLRQALDWLRDSLAGPWAAQAERLLIDPWRARDEYVSVLLDGSQPSIEAFLATQARRTLETAERVRALKLLELQRQTLLMYTSCGWFFDEISGIETVQILLYAARAIELARDLLGEDLEAEFLRRLDAAPSNLAAHPTGRDVWERHVRPSIFDPARLAANHLAARLLDGPDGGDTGRAYRIDLGEPISHESGPARLIEGEVALVSPITLERHAYEYALLHHGDHNLRIGVRPLAHAPPAVIERGPLEAAFARGDLVETDRLVEERYGARAYTLRALCRDTQRRLLRRVLDAKVREAEAVCRGLTDRHESLLRFIASADVRPPAVLEAAAQVVLNVDLRQALEAEAIDLRHLDALLERAARTGVALDRAGLGYVATAALDRISERLLERPFDPEVASRLADLISRLARPTLELDLRRVENRYYRLVQGAAGTRLPAALARLGEVLRVAAPATPG